MHILKSVYKLGINNHKTVSNEKDINQAEPYRLGCPITTKLGMIVIWHKISQNK